MVPVENLPLEIVAVPDSAKGKFSDTLDVDSEKGHLYMGDNWSGGLDIFDINGERPEFLRTVKLRGRLYGVAVASELNRVFVGMTGSTVASVRTDDPKFAVTLINTGGAGHVDLIDYDHTHRRVYAANRLDGLLTTIDAETGKVLGQVAGLGHGLEQPRFNPADGFVYVTDNVENAIYQVDPKGHVLVKTHSLEVPCFPNGMAINPSTNQGLLACSKAAAHTVAWDFNRHEVAAIVEECGGADGVAYAASIDRFLVAASGSTDGPVLGVFAGAPSGLVAKVSTRPAASWVAFEPKTARLFMPAVENDRPALLSLSLTT